MTYPNPNVAFELGYCISTFKPIWLSLNTSLRDVESTFKHSYAGNLGLGYRKYINHRELSSALLADEPWKEGRRDLLGPTYRDRRPHSENPSLFHSIPPFLTDAVIATRDLVSASVFQRSTVTDDPAEVSRPTLTWYADNVAEADAVLIHLLSSEHREASEHNTKASWIAGLAHGFGRPLLMLAHQPFDCPTDYQTLLVEHSTADDAVIALNSWLPMVAPKPRRMRRPEERRAKDPQRLLLRDISLGQPVAENERSHLDDYFVETNDFFEAQKADVSIYVGRKGTGKTALFVALEEHFRRNRHNHVCTLRPVGYEVDGLVRLLTEDWDNAERGYLVESLWKFLIYSELAKSVNDSVLDRALHEGRTKEEQHLVDYISANFDVLSAPFSQRLNRAVGQLSGAGALQDTETQRARISEHLHTSQIGELRRLLGHVLQDMNRVVVLIDDLDHQWQAGTNTQALSTLLVGLLRVNQEVVTDFKRGRQHRKQVNVALTTFIRSDIFSHLESLATEQDKWPLRRMTWNDPELLIRVVDERLTHAGQTNLEAKEIWRRAFPQRVGDLTPQQFLLQNILPRPRDAVYLSKEAIAIAVNRNHDSVSEEDMLLAKERYSQYAFGSILAEDDPERQDLESVLYEFAGSQSEINELEVKQRIQRVCAETPDADFYLNLLLDVNFLGIHTPNGPSFPDNENERQKQLHLATTLAREKENGQATFEIHPAFYDALEIQ